LNQRRAFFSSTTTTPLFFFRDTSISSNMGITKDLKAKLTQQQGYQPVSTNPEPETTQVAKQPQTLADRYQLSVGTGAFIVFLLGIVFWASLANITVNVLMREWPNETGHPRVSPILNIGVSSLGVLTAVMGFLWLLRRQSFILFLGFIGFALLTSLYLISSGVLLSWTFGGHLRDCPHEYTVYAHHSYHRGWTFTCEKFNIGMYTLAVSALTFDVLSTGALFVLLIICIVHHFPYAIALLDERARRNRSYVLVTDEESLVPETSA
jgi:hypothetical protein